MRNLNFEQGKKESSFKGYPDSSTGNIKLAGMQQILSNQQLQDCAAKIAETEDYCSREEQYQPRALL